MMTGPFVGRLDVAVSNGLTEALKPCCKASLAMR